MSQVRSSWRYYTVFTYKLQSVKHANSDKHCLIKPAKENIFNYVYLVRFIFVAKCD